MILFNMKVLLIIVLILCLGSLTNQQNTNNKEPEERPATNEPKFLSQSGEIEVREGTDLDLRCDVEDLGEFVILWKFNKTQVLFAGNLRIHRDNKFTRNDSTGSLNIKNFQLENAGEYSCQISTNPPRDIVYTIKVIAPPIIRKQPQDGQVVVRKNDPIRLSCDIVGDSTSTSTSTSPSIPTKISWKKNEKSFDTKVYDSSELLIPKAQPNDTGIYECIAVNQIGESSATFHVRVLYAPEIDAKESVIHSPLGSEVLLVCQIHSEPPSTTVWFHNNSSVFPSNKYKIFQNNESSSLRISQVSAEDYGNYTCSADNSIGRGLKTIEVTRRPSKPQFVSEQISDKETAYQLIWTLLSEPHIKSYSLRIREVDHNVISDQINEWKHLDIDPKPEDNGEELPKRKQSFLIENLTKGKSYEVDLLVENDFGSTRSETFSFVTSSDSNGFNAKKSQKFIIGLILIIIKIIV